jgi:chromosome segregation ATPase
MGLEECQASPEGDDTGKAMLLIRYTEIKRLWRAIHELEENQLSTQADVDALVAQIGQVEADLTTAQSTLQAEIDSLVAANPALDLSALQAAVAPLDAQVQALGALKPTA